MEDTRKNEEINEALEEVNSNSPHRINKLGNLWQQNFLIQCQKKVVQEMSKQIDIPTILEKIISEHHEDDLIHVKSLMLSLLKNLK